MPTTADPRSGVLEVRGLHKAFGALYGLAGKTIAGAFPLERGLTFTPAAAKTCPILRSLA